MPVRTWYETSPSCCGVSGAGMASPTRPFLPYSSHAGLASFAAHHSPGGPARTSFVASASHRSAPFQGTCLCYAPPPQAPAELHSGRFPFSPLRFSGLLAAPAGSPAAPVLLFPFLRRQLAKLLPAVHMPFGIDGVSYSVPPAVSGHPCSVSLCFPELSLIHQF